MFRAALMRCERYAAVQALAARRRLGATHAFYPAEFVLTRHDVWITIQIINASSRSQPRTAQCRPTPATGPGTRIYGTGRRATPTPAEISESLAMAREFTNRVNYYGLNNSVVP
jgi:hypothetical protein